MKTGRDKCPRCGAEADEINRIVMGPDPPTSWTCGTYDNGPDAPMPGIIKSLDCDRRVTIARLTAVMHANRMHPDYSYIVLPSSNVLVVKDALISGGYELCPEYQVSGDECWRRRRDGA